RVLRRTGAAAGGPALGVGRARVQGGPGYVHRQGRRYGPLRHLQGPAGLGTAGPQPHELTHRSARGGVFLPLPDRWHAPAPLSADAVCSPPEMCITMQATPMVTVVTPHQTALARDTIQEPGMPYQTALWRSLLVLLALIGATTACTLQRGGDTPSLSPTPVAERPSVEIL